jgi:phosphatidylserine/phosphatidylglycerophosphate/cardiolipin synthase-like enzyme
MTTPRQRHRRPSLRRGVIAFERRAEHSIDMAAYILTDWPVMQALARAAGRGVKVRVYLDGAELSKDEEQAPFSELAATPGDEMRVKRDSALMHLKSYAIDGNVLLTGAANFSASGLKRQDNDLIVIESAEAAAAFRKDFEAMFENGAISGNIF